MGNLTDDMTRLRGEVDALRGARGALINGLTRGARDLTTAVAAMRADFSAAHTTMAKKTGKERETFVAAVIDEVNSLLGGFSRNRNDKARKGRHDRKTFLSDMRRQVTDLCKETADDMMGARLAWRGESPGKSRPVPMKKKPVFVKRAPPPMEAALKTAMAAPEFKTEKPPVELKKPLKKEVVVKPLPPPVKAARKKTIAAASEIKAKKPAATFMESPKKEDKKAAVATVPAPPAVEPPKVKKPLPVFAAPEAPKRKEKSWLDEKPTKTMTKAKRGRKFNAPNS
ncbi:MAG: hypothetical protein V1766_05625 [Pseudomonadota bacterium]